MRLEQVERLLNKRSVCNLLSSQGYKLRESMTEYLLNAYPQNDLDDSMVINDMTAKLSGTYQEQVIVQQPVQSIPVTTQTQTSQSKSVLEQTMSYDGSKEQFKIIAFKFGAILVLVAVGTLALKIFTAVDNTPVLGEISTIALDAALMILTGKTVSAYAKSK